MVNLIVSVVVLCKAIVRKCHGCIPVAVLAALYELAVLFEAAMLEYAGLVERVIVICLCVSVFFAWRKGQVGIHANFFAAAVLLLRWGWGLMYDWFRKVMQYPGSDAIALMQQAAAVRSVIDGLICALILILQISILWKLRKSPEI